MDLFQVEEFIKQLHPGKKVTLEFDDKCIRKYEIISTDGKPHINNHIEYDKIKASIEGEKPIYLSINTHRETVGWKKIKEKINDKKDVFIHPEYIRQIKNSENPEKLTQELSNLSDLPINEIKSRINSLQD